jgi:hypothetical protein
MAWRWLSGLWSGKGRAVWGNSQLFLPAQIEHRLLKKKKELLPGLSSLPAVRIPVD